MGIIENLFGLVFGDASRRTIEVFRENAEKSAERQHERHAAALGQFSAEFIHARRDRFGSFIDGLNRLPRPLMAFGVLALFSSAMADPIWFATRMQGLALVPEPLWWLLGAVISFYFGARHQAKGQAFQKSLLDNMALMPSVLENINMLEDLRRQNANMQKDDLEDNRALSFATGPNAAIEDWKKLQKRDK